MKKNILGFLLIILSLPVAAQYKIIFNNSSLNLPETSEVQSVLSFDGPDNVSVPHSTEFNITNTITLEALVYYTKLPSVMSSRYPALIDKSNQTYRFGVYQADTDQMGLRLNYNITNHFQSNYTINALTGQWVHFAVTFDGRYMKFYENGVQVHSADHGSYISINTDISDLSIGSGWEGKISNVRVWKVVRTQTEIQSNINAELTGSETGLVAYYKLDSGNGTIAVDSAGNNDGTINGATWVEK